MKVPPLPARVQLTARRLWASIIRIVPYAFLILPITVVLLLQVGVLLGHLHEDAMVVYSTILVLGVGVIYYLDRLDHLQFFLFYHSPSRKEAKAQRLRLTVLSASAVLTGCLLLTYQPFQEEAPLPWLVFFDAGFWHFLGTHVALVFGVPDTGGLPNHWLIDVALFIERAVVFYYVLVTVRKMVLEDVIPPDRVWSAHMQFLAGAMTLDELRESPGKGKGAGRKSLDPARWEEVAVGLVQSARKSYRHYQMKNDVALCDAVLECLHDAPAADVPESPGEDPDAPPTVPSLPERFRTNEAFLTHLQEVLGPERVREIWRSD